MVKQTYAKSGVNIAQKAKVIDRIRQHASSTLGSSVLSGVGFFGGMFEFKGYKEPVLVSSVDGVGTKTKIAIAMGVHSTVGIDIVNHCINDIMTGGADPLFFLDYIGIGKVKPEKTEAIVKGVADACREAGCALIGGEIAEMPDVYHKGDYDLVGCIIGVVEKGNIVMGKDIQLGDAVIGLPSSGLHTNGFTLARKILGDTKAKLGAFEAGLGMTVGEALLKPHRSYQKELKAARHLLKGISHITGGGIIGNLSRILPKGLAAKLDSTTWNILPIFNLLQKNGNVSTKEMLRVFNMGLGMILVCSPENTKKVLQLLPDGKLIGEIIPQKGVSRVFVDGKGYRSDKVLQ